MSSISDAMTNKATFALNLKRLRRHSSIGQQPLADACGVTLRTWGRWESMTDSAWPNSKELPLIANILHCSIDDIYSHEPDWLPSTSDERELLKVVRSSNIPALQIARVMINAMDGLLNEDRTLWLRLGRRLSKNLR